MQIGYVRYIAKLFSRDNWPKINSLFTVGLRNVFVLSVSISITTFLVSDFLSTHLLGNEELSSTIKIFSISQKREIFLLFFLSIFAMIFETLSIASIFPFLDYIFEGSKNLKDY